MRCVDADVLVYAHREDAREHEAYRDWLRLCREADARGNLVPDAYLAAMVLETGGTWYSADRGFARFPGLDWRHPLDEP